MAERLGVALPPLSEWDKSYMQEQARRRTGRIKVFEAELSEEPGALDAALDYYEFHAETIAPGRANAEARLAAVRQIFAMDVAIGRRYKSGEDIVKKDGQPSTLPGLIAVERGELDELNTRLPGEKRITKFGS